MEQILTKLGDPGRYHIVIATMFAITWWSVCLGNVSMAFYGFTPKYTCDVGHNSTDNEMLGSDLSLCNFTISEDQCSYTVHNCEYGEGKREQPCRRWKYETDGSDTRTIATEVSAICATQAPSRLLHQCPFLNSFIYNFHLDVTKIINIFVCTCF